MNLKGGILVKLVIAVLGSVAMVSAAHARSKPIIDPPKTQSPCTLSEERMLQGINGGLIGRGWVITDRQPGLLTAKVLVRGKHTLEVTIAYTSDSYDIDYKDSVNLNYHVDDDGTQYLHPNGISWMENIRSDIAKQLEFMCSLDQDAAGSTSQ